MSTVVRTETSNRSKFWSRWMVSDTLAILMASGALSAALNRPPRTPNSIGVAVLIIGVGSVFGGIDFGLLQGSALLLWHRTVTLREWFIAPSVGSTLIWTSSVGAETLGLDYSTPEPLPATNHLLIGAGLGSLIGAGISMPQGWVLQRHGVQAIWWILANTAAWAAGVALFFHLPLTLRSGITGPVVPVLIIGTLLMTAVLISLITGITLLKLDLTGYFAEEQ